MPDIQMLI